MRIRLPDMVLWTNQPLGHVAALRALEPHMPPWLTRILLGSNTPPTYPATHSTAR